MKRFLKFTDTNPVFNKTINVFDKFGYDSKEILSKSNQRTIFLF